MYVPRHFRQDDEAEIRRLIDSARVADLVTVSSGRPSASLIPFLFVDDTPRGALHGHLARSNDQWQNVHAASEALAIFRGPDSYVTPRWYPAKVETGRVVPTWNYAVVHVYGRVIVHDDPAWTRQLVGLLTDEMEASSPTPWSIDDAPEGYIDGMLKGIVGIELQISRVEAKWKLSQNQPARQAAGVLGGLSSADDERARMVAELMRTQTPRNEGVRTAP